jgi:hypothetical protein
MRVNVIAAAVSVACATAMLAIASPVVAQSGSGLTREQVQAACADFMKTHEWTESRGWVLKRGAKEPAKSRKTNAQIKAETEAFLAKNRWDDVKSVYVSIEGKPRNVSKMTRAQVNKEAAEFHRTHVWDEAASSFVSCKP